MTSYVTFAMLGFVIPIKLITSIPQHYM